MSAPTMVDCPRCGGAGVYDDEDPFGRTLHDVECPRCDGAGQVDADTVTVDEDREIVLARLGALLEEGKSGALVCQVCQGEGCTVCGDMGLVPQTPGPVAA